MWQNFRFLVEHEFLLGCRLGDDDCCNDNHDGNFDDNDEKMTKKTYKCKEFWTKNVANFPFLVEHDGSSCLAAAQLLWTLLQPTCPPTIYHPTICSKLSNKLMADHKINKNMN